LGGANFFDLANAPLPWKWYYFRGRFAAFIANLAPTTNQIGGVARSLPGVVAALNTHYWGFADESANAALGGSWGKGLAVRPPRDVDLFFVLPNEVYHRIEQRVGNRQSQLLQEVKGVLIEPYPRTPVQGDGQVVLVPFAHAPIEVVPAFRLQNGRLLICDAKGGGRYVETDLAAEIRALDLADKQFNGCGRLLVRMAKVWQRECNVPIKSFMLERLVLEFLPRACAAQVRYQWWDWLMCDFFAYITTRANGFVTMPGTGEQVFLGDAWLSRAQSAVARAQKACDYEKDNEDYLAGSTWQMVFGALIPASAAL